MTPIIKNDAFLIRVKDENENELAPTYIKRARGLVKKGRARFVGEDEIMLTGGNFACPDIDAALPRKEDTEMNNNNIINATADMYNITPENSAEFNSALVPDSAQPVSCVQNTVDTASRNPALTVEYVLSRIDKIINDNALLHETLINLTVKFPINESPDGGTGDAARAQAVKEIVLVREQTNQMLMQMLCGILYSLVPDTKPKPDAETEADIESSVNAQSFEIKKTVADGIQSLLRDMDTSSNTSIDVLAAIKDLVASLYL